MSLRLCSCAVSASLASGSMLPAVAAVRSSEGIGDRAWPKRTRSPRGQRDNPSGTAIKKRQNALHFCVGSCVGGPRIPMARRPNSDKESTPRSKNPTDFSVGSFVGSPISGRGPRGQFRGQFVGSAWAVPGSPWTRRQTAHEVTKKYKNTYHSSRASWRLAGRSLSGLCAFSVRRVC